MCHFYRSQIVNGAGDVVYTEAETPNIMSCEDYQDFWVSWEYTNDNRRHLRVGRGQLYNDVIMEHRAIFGRIDIHAVSLLSSNTNVVNWVFPDNAGKQCNI